MSLKLTGQLFKWLQSVSLVKQAKRSNDLLQLSQQVSQKFFDGLSISILLKSSCKHILDQQSIKKLQTLKQNSNPAIRLYNWNILIEILKKCKIIQIDNTEKSKIVNFEYQPVMRILKALYDHRDNTKNEQKKGLKVQITQIHKKSIKQTTNSLQLLILILSKNFKLSPQHTLNLFIDNNKFLSHLIVKGVKSSFLPIYDFLTDLKSNIPHIITRIFYLDEQQNVNFFFNAIKSCLISKDTLVMEMCLQLFQEIYIGYKIQGISIKVIKKWILTDGINTLFFAVNKNTQFFGQIVKICYQYMENQLFAFFQFSQKNLLWSNDKEKLKIFRKIITLELDKQQSQKFFNKFINSNYINEWFKYFIKNCKKFKQTEQIYEMNIIFENLWLKMQQRFQQQSLNLINTYFQFIKQCLSSNSYLIFSSSIISTLNLLKILGQQKNQYAPLLYRTMITIFTNLPSSDTQKISFICINLGQSFKLIPNLPGSQLIPALIKHLQSNTCPQLLFLIKKLFQQNRITQQQSAQLLDLLTKTQYSQYTIQMIFQIIPGINDQIADDYLMNNIKLFLSQYYSQAKMIIKPLKQIKNQVQSDSQNGQDNQKKSQIIIGQLKKYILCSNLIIFFNKYLDLDDINLKNNLESMLFHTYVKIKVQLKKKKIADLLLPLMKRYYEYDEELQEKIIEYQKQAFPQPTKQPKQSLLSKNRLNKSLDLSLTQNTQRYKTIDPTTLTPSIFALKQLQSLKQKKQHFKTIQNIKLSKQVQFQQRQKKIKNFLNQKRLIEFGSAGKVDYNYKNMYDYDTMKQQQVVSGVPVIKLMSFDKEEEVSYEEDLNNVMKKYRKVWRFLFFKFSTFGAKKQEFKIEEKIHMSQIWKMLREYQIFPFIKKQQSQLIIKLINDIMKRKNDPQSLTYPGFQQYITQLCYYSNNRSFPSLHPHLPTGRQILLFIQQLKSITKQKGGSIQLFQNPQDVYFQQTDVIRQYNRRLKQNPEYILPQGYKKYKQVSLEFQYNVHPMLKKGMKRSYVDVYEVLAEILYQRLGIQVIEPLTMKSEVTLAKPVLFQQINQKMKEYKKGYLQPKSMIELDKQPEQNKLVNNSIKNINKINNSTIVNSLNNIINNDTQNIRKSLILKRQFKPLINFSLGIKLGLSSVSLKDKSIAEDVAYWMHDMLNAVVNQSLKVQNIAKKKIENVIIKKRKVQSLDKIKKEKQQKKQWKKRAESVKNKLEIQKKLKEQENIKKRQEQIQQKRKKRAREQQYLKLKLKRFQDMKKLLDIRKQQQKYKKIEQQQKKKQQFNIYKQKVQQYFQNKKQQLLNKQEQMKKKKQQQEKYKQQQKQKKQKFMKQVYLNNLKKQQELIEKAQQIKQDYRDLWQSGQIQAQLKKHQKQLQILFNLLLKHQKGKISSTSFDQIGLNTLHFFALKFSLIPFLIQKNDLVKIFNFIIKQKQRRNKSQSNVKQLEDNQFISIKPRSPGLNFKFFEQALFLIVIKSKKTLNKINQKRKKKFQKLLQFVNNAKKASSGNHFQTDQVSQSQQSQSSQQQQQQSSPGLLNQYLFNPSDVTEQTLSLIFNLLKLPKDKIGIQQRYRQVVQMKNNKPKKVIKNEMYKMLINVNIEEIGDNKKDNDKGKQNNEDEDSQQEDDQK